MNPITSKLLFMAGARYRNPSLWQEYERLKQSEWLGRQDLLSLQVERAGRFFEFIEKHSPYYKKIFRECGFSASKFDSVENLRQLPLCTKSQLLAHNKLIHSDYSFARTFLAETSGTTGSALEFRKNERWDSINRANMYRAYDWYGVKPWSRYGYLWGYNISGRQAAKTRLLDEMQNRFRMFSYDKQDIIAFSKKLASAAYLTGYSSMIYEVAKAITSLGLEKPALQMVKGTSEMILDVYQVAAREAFGCKIVSEYGAAESGLIAFECPYGSMHINVEDVIVELDNDGQILVTNLASYSFPIIRYKLGDTITLLDEMCACGRSHPVIKEVIGRKGLTVYGRRRTYPALTFYYVFKNLAMEQSIYLNYKAVQEEEGVVDIFIEGVEHNCQEIAISDELKKYFQNDMKFNLLFVKHFDRERKKMQYFESAIDRF